MAIIKTVTRYELKCDAITCGWEWTTNADKLPVVCPSCKSRRWNAGRSEGVAKVRKREEAHGG